MKFSDYLKPQGEINERPIKFEALNTMKEIQTTLSGLSFLDVIAVMREENPLKKEVHELENKLHDLTQAVGQFIADNIEDAVDVTDDDRKSKIDNAVKDAEDDVEIAKKSSKSEEE